MEDSVKDLDGDINPSTPEPRFSIGSKSPVTNMFCSNISGDWKQTYKSMNDDDDWVICSNRQDAELDADIRSVLQPLSDSTAILWSCRVYMKTY